MSWLWTFGRVPELDSTGINAVSQRIQAMSEKERVQPDAPRIIDVRTRGEYEAGHIAGAVHASFLPPWSWPSNVAPVLAGGVDKGTPLFVICLSAHRSIGALKWLRDQGYTNVQQLKGGMQAWRAAKMPEVTKTMAASGDGSSTAAGASSASRDSNRKQDGGAGGAGGDAMSGGCCQAQTQQAAGGSCAGAGVMSEGPGPTSAAGGGTCCQK
ncbi:hypothetical protein CHLRE_14g630950v5 [Chlamydomonas reinhardtii]|uniref:Uncharacterized protein n=1 Tax=Chlamydomonas reinhardtii TaxID=3055 RepID=A8IUT5_CHLRE|nr:uncharacterized protein CHLRE_14g630950v5 [Chlamydomonas reinhardtii]PNW73410.1 hypothetical protein CHLRE_14g630950v5 [Chlamydomonas reinhardtii]|eukprot:XP_001692770.1 predicted protein [Chlamydomonas reinhardtii]